MLHLVWLFVLVFSIVRAAYEKVVSFDAQTIDCISKKCGQTYAVKAFVFIGTCLPWAFGVQK